MNLHGIASPYVGVVNPPRPGTVRVSTGYTTADDGERTPTYADHADVPLQIQAMTFGDLRQVDGLNLNGTRRGIYVGRRVDGLVRPDNKGGDLVVVPKAAFTAEIIAGLMTVSEVASGELAVGDALSGPGIADGSKIAALGTGTGGVGTYTVEPSQDVDEGEFVASTVWLVALVLEAWPDWCKVAAVLQNSE